MLEIVPYEDRHADAWRELNEAWISKDFVIEPKDRVVLDHPREAVLNKGGRIFMAELDGIAVGCCALLAMEDGGFEVAKMTSAEVARGQGVGRALMNACVSKATTERAPRLYLETNSRCEPAIALYESVGFRHLAPEERPVTDYVRADVFMELKL